MGDALIVRRTSNYGKPEIVYLGDGTTSNRTYTYQFPREIEKSSVKFIVISFSNDSNASGSATFFTGNLEYLDDGYGGGSSYQNLMITDTEFSFYLSTGISYDKSDKYYVYLVL